MSSWLSFVVFAAAIIVPSMEARTIPAKPVSLMMNAAGDPVVFVRDKRTPVGPYPHRAMMFTGYYRPARRTDDAQATGVFAQGNAVSGGTYLVDGRPNYDKQGPEPADEPDVSSAEAEAAPSPLDHHVDEEKQNYPTQEDQQPEQQDSQPAQEEEQDPSIHVTEAPIAEEEPAIPTTQRPHRPSKKQGPKKIKKTPIPVLPETNDDDEVENDDDDEYDEVDDEPAMPFVPFKANRRRQGNVPNLNNFFPMVFSFPKSYARDGSSSSGSPPGTITAIANSYSTSKGGVASSVATAYGGSPSSKKQRRSQPVRE